MVIPVVDEGVWRSRLDGLGAWHPPTARTVVVAPHPDDETLAAGGLIFTLRSAGVPVTVVAVTDGERAYEGMNGLGELREREQAEALAALGVGELDTVRLRLPDSGLAGCEGAIVDGLRPLVDAGTHVIAPWVGDFHPDHEACGRAAETVTRESGALLSYYFFWTWHRGKPGLVEGLELVRLPLGGEALQAKESALRCHRSQLWQEGGQPILPEGLLAPARRPYEVFLPW
jgi:LmbE family N-acetylglucosaminyl deacetylase